MKVLVVGSGGREHALVWKIKQSPKVTKLYCASGNGGTASIAENIPIKAENISALLEFSKKEKIDLTIVGPEAPLALGIVDLFQGNNLRIFGPTKAAAQLEASKIFMKELAKDENIPTAEFEIFEDPDKAKDYIKSKKTPIVVKADGLAAGKGVIVAKTQEEACNAIDTIMLKKEFGDSGNKAIVEECLEGEEASIIVVSDGENVVPLASSQDHKRVFDKDKGPNTGGMGAYSPAPVVTDKVFNDTISQIIEPTIKGMKKRGILFKGILYAGIMIKNEESKLLEFNVRMGDPETEAILPRLTSDIVELMELAMQGSLKDYTLTWDERACVSVVMASGGYPGKYEKEKEITGIEKALKLKDVIIFHAGTKLENEKILTNGGRVLNVVGLGSDIKSAVEKAYEACNLIKFDGAHYRRDIGYRALNKKVNIGKGCC